MGSVSEEDCLFFDANEDIASVSDGSSVCDAADYDLWARSPKSVEERRSRFFTWMMGENQAESSSIATAPFPDHTIDDEEEEIPDELYEYVSNATPIAKCSSRVARSNNSPRRFAGWLNRLRTMSCVVDKQNLHRNESDTQKLQRVKVTQRGKRLKELSAVYASQDIQAHRGAILAMKFSPDGEYLASGGMDGVLRMWKVLEDSRTIDLDPPNMDPSCLFFTLNHLSELKTVKKIPKSKTLRKTSDSACVIFPLKAFRIVETPVHEFTGHTGEILSLSWSSNNHILSSSVDTTVRLWRKGCDDCLRVFSHSNFVTCVEFNPIDENHFISGSIDGKVRIWDISACHVVDWIDVKDIVTAVSYRPDGRGGIIGSIEGKCRFYSLTERHLQLESEILLSSKKKSQGRRITGFLHFPEDFSKVIVTSADSQVRVLQGREVVTKYKSSRNLSSASLSSSRRHIISASEDSHVYVFNHKELPAFTRPHTRTVKSNERFAADAAIAIPWCGFSNGDRNALDFHRLNGVSSPSSFSISQEFFLQSFPRGSATWPEEKFQQGTSPLSPLMHSSRFNFLKASCLNAANSHAWGMVIVTAGYDGRIRSFQNYGLPVTL